MGEVVKLKTERDEIVASVIEVLEGVLAEAYEGNVAAVALGVVYSDGGIAANRSRADGNISTLLGTLELLRFRILRHWDDSDA